ncbi:MAG: LCP family protein [bacterium]
MKKRGNALVYILTLTSILTIISSIFILILFSKSIVLEMLLSIVPQQIVSGKNILAFGIDDTQKSKRADTIMVFHINKNNNHIGVISIPRDTRVKLENIGMTKINHAYAYEGVGLLKESVSQLLGLPIHNYIQLNVNQVKNIIDKLEGIKIDVEKDLVYQDLAAGLNINIKKGKQVLNGEETIQFLRFRKDNKGDIGRINRQQLFLESLAETITKPKKILTLPSLISTFSKMIESDLKKTEMLSLAKTLMQEFKEKNIKKTIVPGSVALIEGISYWKPNLHQLDKNIENILLGFEKEKDPIKENQPYPKNVLKKKETGKRQIRIDEIRRGSTQITKENNIEFQLLKDLRIEILNGCGKKGIAHEKARRLKQKKLKIIRIENAGHFNYEETKIVSWKNNSSDALRLANALNIDPKNIILYNLPNKKLEITLVIGKDWENKTNEE